MTNPERDEQGRFSKKVTDKEILEIVTKEQPIGTADVAKKLDIHRNTASTRLKKLERKERVNSKKIGESVAWFIEQ